MTSNATPTWVIPVVPIGAVSAGAVAWRRGGKLHISPIVKTTFAFAAGAPMTPAPPVPVHMVEQRRDPKDPESSIREGLDTAPSLVRADVVFVGDACAPSSMPATHVTVRLAICAARTDGQPGPGEVLLDKRLEVLGDRIQKPGRPPPEPSAFTRVPMIYERTYGGPDHNPNPVGMGVMAELGGKRRLPNIVHPARSAQPGVEPAGLAPISLEWAARRRMLRATPRRALEQPVVEIPDDLDPLYFQSAPADQRLPDPKPANAGAPFLRGDEWIVLEGLHKLQASFSTQLPGARGVAHVYLPDGSHRPVVLVADTLLIDGDAERCTLTWRGAFPLPSLADLPSTGVVAGVEWPGRAVVWPEHFPRVARPPQADGYPEISVVEESMSEQQLYRSTLGAPPPRPLGAPPPLPLGAPPPLPLGGPPPLPLGAPPPLPLAGPPAVTFGAPPPVPPAGKPAVTFGAPPPVPPAGKPAVTFGAPPPVPPAGKPAVTFGAPPPLPAGAPPQAPVQERQGRQRTVMLELDAPPPAPSLPVRQPPPPAPAAPERKERELLTVMMDPDARPPVPSAAAAPKAATPPPTTNAPVVDDAEWGTGTMVLDEGEEPPAPPPAGGRQKTTVLDLGSIPAAYPAAARGAPPAPPPPAAPAARTPSVPPAPKPRTPSVPPAPKPRTPSVPPAPKFAPPPQAQTRAPLPTAPLQQPPAAPRPPLKKP